jgi:citrate synthase
MEAERVKRKINAKARQISKIKMYKKNYQQKVIYKCSILVTASFLVNKVCFFYLKKQLPTSADQKPRKKKRKNNRKSYNENVTSNLHLSSHLNQDMNGVGGEGGEKAATTTASLLSNYPNTLKLFKDIKNLKSKIEKDELMI